MFEKSWRKNMTMNAAIKLGLEALRESLGEPLNKDAVEIAVVKKDGYKKLERDDTVALIEKLKPFEE
jgi:proteasome alpha subunit